MLASIRARLTAWYAAAFLLFALVFAAAAYAFVAHATYARVDEELAETADAVAESLGARWRRGEPASVAVPTTLRDFRLGDAAVAIFDRATGAIALAFEVPTGEPGWRKRFAPPAPPDYRVVLARAPQVASFATAGSGRSAVRLYTRPFDYGGRALIIGISQSLAAPWRTLRDARLGFAVGVPVMLLVAVAGGYALAWRGLRPVAEMTEQAARLGAGTLHERIPAPRTRDELARLAAVFNALLERLEAAFAQQRRFMADASHELRTPVAIIAGEAELALERGERDAGELRTAIVTIEQETKRLQRIVDDLFLLARADAGERPRTDEELYLADLVAEVAGAVRTLAARKSITVTQQVDGDLPIRGDEGLLRRLLLNLVDNAIKYSPAGSSVSVTGSRRGDEYVIEVTDTGPGVAPELRDRIFDRFVRGGETGADGSEGPRRGSEGSGAGLGLAIAKWIAESHGGQLALTRSGPRGSTFTVTLPAPAP